jgi:hypothetical protein
MLKNKKQIFLIAIVVVLYGFVALRFSEALDDDLATQDHYGIIQTREVSIQKKYNLDLSYRDPFFPDRLKPNYQPQKIESARLKKVTERSITQKPQERMMKRPEVSLSATINSENVDADICILKINQQEVVLKENDTCSQMKVLKIYHDSVKIGYRNQLFTVKTK